MVFKKKIVDLISKKTGVPANNISGLLVVPPKGLGDYSLPCFVIAKKMGKSPVVVSQELSASFSESFLEKVEAKGPYLNFYLSKKDFSESVLKKIFSKKITLEASERIMVEYSSPNTNKPLHLGHLRNNSLGVAVINLLKEKGFFVVKANLFNDRGIHICKSMLAYDLFGENRDPVKEGIKTDHFVGEMYVLFEKKNLENPELKLEEKARGMLKQWESSDKRIIALWKKMNAWAINGINETYTDFGVTFDKIFFESELFFDKQKDELIKEGLEKNVFVREENNAVVAKLEPELQNKVIVRRDGTTLYATNDLLLTQKKFDDFSLDKSIWVVANEQDLYFKQLFKMFEKLGRPWVKQCYQLSYGYVSLTTGRMKSREGRVVDADDLLKDLTGLALSELNNRYESMGEKEKNRRAKIIALSAIKFFLLKNDSKKDMVFDPKKSISFEGETGPYLLYALARAKSIQKKALKEKKVFKKKNFELLTKSKEKELVNALQGFDVAVKKSVDQLSPHHVCHNLLSITEKFNSYYHETRILDSETQELLNARLSLVEATIITLSKGLTLLGIEFLEEM